MIAHQTASGPEPTLGSNVAPIDGDRIHGEVRVAGRVVLVPTAGCGPSVDHLMSLLASDRGCDRRPIGAPCGAAGVAPFATPS